ncbi:MAG: ABC transporter ATP-binding protein [Chloroflexi bacterium]|nr:ABC transporter ATP-binding protein [Chloroflexota bacterium]
MIDFPGGGRGGRGRRDGRGSASAARVGLSGPLDTAGPPPTGRASDGPTWRPSALTANARTTWTGFQRVLRLVWEANPQLTVALALLNLLQGVLPAARVYLAKVLIDDVVAAVSTGAGMAALPRVALLVAAQFGVSAVSNLGQTLANISQQLLQERVANRVQLLLMRHANSLDLIYFERPAFYDLIQQVQREAGFRPTAMVQTAFGVVRQLLTFGSMLALLVNLEWFIAVAALLSPIPAFISNARYGWQGYLMSRRQSPLRRMMSYLTTVLTTDTFNKELKLFTLGEFFVTRFQQLFERYYDENKRLVIRRYMAGAIWSMLTVVASGATFLYVALRALAGRVTVGDLTLYVQAAEGVSQSFVGLLGGLQSMYEHQLYLSSLFEVLDMQPNVVRPPHPVPVRRPFQQGIEFRHVTYTYEGHERPALEDLSFTIATGETVAVVGHNGAGKTTLVKVLARLYDVHSGQILIDGHDVRAYDPDELRSQFGVLFQDYVTYQLSARENIGVGRSDALDDLDRVTAAAAKSGASGVIEKLPEGYETVLGKWFDGGAQLSGGEWQKVALGRAFMRDAQILILDEPSAALDAEAEFDLFTRLKDLTSGRTAIFISHRFSTVRRADRILVLEQGRLIEQGTHQELMRLDGRYAELFNLQAASYR